MLGGKWRMPTDAEWTELRERCEWTWTTRNDVYGYKVTAPNGNSIFLPAAGRRFGKGISGAGSKGHYWSSSIYTDSPDDALEILFDYSYVNSVCSNRYSGPSVRPVSE